MFSKFLKILSVVMLFGAGAHAYAEQGITDTEIIIGSNQDMSGPFAGFGAPGMSATKQYFDKINAKGGIHGRTLKLIVEDNGYQLPKAMQNMNKLINSDKIFIMYMQMGTHINKATFDQLEAKKVINWMPLSGSETMANPYSDLRYAGGAGYFTEMKTLVQHVSETTGKKKVCAMILPIDFGKEISAGSKAGAEAAGGEFLTQTAHKPDEEDFVGALSKLKAAGCEMISLALGLKQQIKVLGTAKKMGLNDIQLIGSSASMHTVLAKVPGGITEGFMVAAGWSDMLSRMGNKEVATWFTEYNKEFNTKLPPTGALLGRVYADMLVRALEKAGRDLNHSTFQKAVESLEYKDVFMDLPVKFGKNDHVSTEGLIISQIVDGNWKELTRK